jgi:hypothetical protein
MSATIKKSTGANNITNSYIIQAEEQVIKTKDTLNEFSKNYKGDIERNEGKPYKENYDCLGTMAINLRQLQRKISALLEQMEK